MSTLTADKYQVMQILAVEETATYRLGSKTITFDLIGCAAVLVTVYDKDQNELICSKIKIANIVNYIDDIAIAL